MKKLVSDFFFNEARMDQGPWEAFERDFGRLLFHKNFNDVRIIGGKGDQGADILGVLDEKLWVFQCKHTTSSIAPVKAVHEVVQAGIAYGADNLGVVISRPPGKTFIREINKYNKEFKLITLGIDQMPAYIKNNQTKYKDWLDFN